MKFSLKSIAAAVVMAAAAAGANAAIDNGAQGNGEMMFSAWDGASSYVYDMNTTIDAFQSSFAAAGNLNLSWGADFTSSYSSWVSTADTTKLQWSILAVDSDAQRRILATVGAATLPAQNNQADTIRTAVGNIQTIYLNAVNPLLAAAGGNSAVTTSTGAASYAGNMGDKVYNKMNFDTSASFANNSYATGVAFEITTGNASGITKATNTAFVDNASPVRAWVAADNTLHIAAAVPEPTEYAMLLAGLGMVGLMARRRKSA